MARIEAGDLDAALVGHERAGDDEGTRLDAVADHAVRDGMELLDALDLHDRGAGAGDLGAHLVQHVREVDDLGLAGSVVDDGRAAGADGSHDEVLGGADAGELKRHRGADKAVGRIGVDVAVVGIELHPKRLETEDMHVDLARAEVAAARHGDLGATAAAQQRTHDGGRGAHLGDELVGSLPRMHLGGIDCQAVLVHDVDRGAQPLENLAHDVNVRDVRHVLENGLARGQQRCRHQLEGRVLGSRHVDPSVQGVSAFNANDIQARSLRHNADI